MTRPGGKRGKGDGPGALRILQSWDDFNEAAMREFLDSVVQDFYEELDELDEALRGTN